jgi:hypothetical protein
LQATIYTVGRRRALAARRRLDPATETGVFEVFPNTQTDGTTYMFRTLTASGKLSEESLPYTVRYDSLAPPPAVVTLGGAAYSPETWYSVDRAVVGVTPAAPPASEVRAQYRTGQGEWTAVPQEGVPLSDGVNEIHIRTADEAGNFDSEEGTPYAIHTELADPRVSVGASTPSGEWTAGPVVFTLSSSSTAPLDRYEVSLNLTDWSAAGFAFDSETQTWKYTTPSAETASTNYFSALSRPPAGSLRQAPPTS